MHDVTAHGIIYIYKYMWDDQEWMITHCKGVQNTNMIIINIGIVPKAIIR